MWFRLCSAFGVLLATNSASLAGLVTFTPPVQFFPSDKVIYSFDLIVESQKLPSFNSVDMVIASDVPFQWAYSPEFIAKSGPLTTPIPIGAWPIDLYVGGVASALASSYGSSILLGTITVDTAGLPPGTYEISVNSNLDGGISNISGLTGSERLVGSGMITTISEPASLLILLVGTITMTYRRRLR